MIRTLLSLRINRIFYQFGVFKKFQAKQSNTQKQSFTSHELSKFHQRLRTNTKTPDFINTLKNSRKQLASIGPMIALEVVMQNLYNWGIDDNIAQIFQVLDQYNFNTLENIEKLNVLCILRSKMRKTQGSFKNHKLNRYIDQNIEMLASNLKNHCLAGKMSFIELQNYFKTFKEFHRYPDAALNFMQKALKQQPTLVARNWNFFMSGYVQYPLFARQKYPFIQKFIAQKLINHLHDFSLFKLALLFKYLCAMKWQNNTIRMKIPPIIDTIVQKLKSQTPNLTYDSTQSIYNAYENLPLSYSNQLLEMCVNHSIKTLLNTTERRIVKVMEKMPLWRINRKLLKPFTDKIQKSLEDRNLSPQLLFLLTLDSPRVMKFLNETKDKILEYIVTDGIPQQLFEKNRLIYLNAIVLLSKSKKPVLIYLKKINNFIINNDKFGSVQITQLTRLLMACVIEKERVGTNQLDSAIIRYKQFILEYLKKVNMATLMKIILNSYQTNNQILSDYHEILYKFTIQNWTRLINDAWHISCLNILDIAKSPSITLFHDQILQSVKDKTPDNKLYLLRMYDLEEDKSKQLAQIIFRMILQNKQHIPDNFILTTIVQTPPACLTDNHGKVIKQLQQLIDGISQPKIEPILLNNAIRQLSSVGADCKKLKEQLVQTNFDKADIVTIESMLQSLRNQGKKEASIELMNKLLKMSTGNVNARILTTILTAYYHVTKMTGRVDQEIVKNLLTRILSQHLEKEFMQTRIGLLLLDAFNFIQLEQQQKAQLRDGVKSGSKYQLMNTLTKNQQEWSNYRQMTRQYQVIRSLVVPLIQQALSQRMDMSLNKAIPLLQFGQQYHSHKIVDAAAQNITKSKITSEDASKITAIMNSGKVPSYKIHHKIAYLIVRYGMSLFADIKIQSLFMLAKAYYVLPQEFMKCINEILNSVDNFMEKSGKTELLFNRSYLNYLWSLLVLGVGGQTKAYECCLQMFNNRVVGLVKSTNNQYLLGLVSDIFHLLYKKNQIKAEVIREMMQHKEKWMRSNCKKIDHEILREGVWKEAFEKDGLLLDYYDGQRALLSLHSYYLHDDGTETGYSKARDLAIEQVYGKIKIIKWRKDQPKKKETKYLQQ